LFWARADKPGKSAEARSQLSHQIFVGKRTWSTYKTVFREVERAADENIDIANGCWADLVLFDPKSIAGN
jgi:hypothetical protein